MLKELKKRPRKLLLPLWLKNKSIVFNISIGLDDFLKDKIETDVIDSIPFMQKGKEIPKKIENIPKNEFSSYGKK